MGLLWHMLRQRVHRHLLLLLREEGHNRVGRQLTVRERSHSRAHQRHRILPHRLQRRNRRLDQRRRCGRPPYLHWFKNRRQADGGKGIAGLAHRLDNRLVEGGWRHLAFRQLDLLQVLPHSLLLVVLLLQLDSTLEGSHGVGLGQAQIQEHLPRQAATVDHQPGQLVQHTGLPVVLGGGRVQAGVDEEAVPVEAINHKLRPRPVALPRDPLLPVDKFLVTITQQVDSN